jgi:hypothetical protein
MRPVNAAMIETSGDTTFRFLRVGFMFQLPLLQASRSPSNKEMTAGATISVTDLAALTRPARALGIVLPLLDSVITPGPRKLRLLWHGCGLQGAH